MVGADIRPEHIAVNTAAVDTAIEHTEVVDTVEAVDIAYTGLRTCNLAAHSARLPMDYHIHRRSAHQEHFVSHNLHTIRIQEQRTPEDLSANSVHNWYRRQSSQKLLYYRPDRNEAWAVGA